MFEKLDQIDWTSLEHAYGSAEDVPQLIRDLASDDASVRDEAFYTAYGHIFHQGTRYQATAPAVPFLLEILDQPDYAAPDMLARLTDVRSRYRRDLRESAARLIPPEKELPCPKA